MQNNNKIKYAGFFSRLAAAIIDYAIIFFLSNFFVHFSYKFSSSPFIVIMILIYWLYFAFAVSKFGGTIGNLISGIKVKSLNSEDRLSLLQTSIRFFLSIAPFAIYQIIRFYQHELIPELSVLLQQLPQLIYILAPLVIFFSSKKQMLHDIVSKTVVINESVKHKDGNSSLYYLRIAIMTFALLGFGSIVAYAVIYTTVFGMLYSSKQQSYSASFHATYKTHDYNDTHILYYKKELEKYAKEFVYAEGMYDIFEADTKIELTQNCIEVLVQEHNSSDWISGGSNFYKNARNRYANTKELIIKAKKNEDHMGRHFYDYDLNDVSSIIKKFIDPFDVNKSKAICNNDIPVQKIYDNKFIPAYIDNREHSSNGVLNESTISKNRIKKGVEWLDILYRHYPKFFERKKERDRKEEELKRQIEEELRQAEIEAKKEKERAYQRDLKNFSYPIFAMIVHKRDRELEKIIAQGDQNNVKGAKGATPLFAAISYGNLHAVKLLLDAGVDPNKVGQYDQLPLTWAIDVGADMEIVDTLVSDGADLNKQYKKSETALTVAAKGCNRFELVKYLLSKGANPNIIDEFGQTTLTGLRRYCRDKKQYQKMKELIEVY